MKRLVIAVAVVSVVAFLAVRGPAPLHVVHAERAVDVSSVTGSWAFEFQGVNPISVGNIPSVGAGVGVINFDGAGNLNGSFTSFDVQQCCITGATTTSTIVTGTFTGTYTLNADATSVLDLFITGVLNPGNVPVSDEIKLTTVFYAGVTTGFTKARFVQTFQSDAVNNATPLPDSTISGRAEKI